MRERLFAGEVILGIKWTCGANKACSFKKG